jgi:hypothetical protein
MLVKLLLENLMRYIDGGYNKIRASNLYNTIVIYEIEDKNGKPFTRIDIFTKERTNV